MATSTLGELMATLGKDLTEFEVLMRERQHVTAYLDTHIREVLDAPATPLSEACAYVIAAPGKLLRPLLMLDACRAAGGNPDQVFPAAVGTEYGHMASLVHDDIIDGDGERHGQAAVHVKYGLDTALLLGDLLIFQTFLSFAACEERGASAERVLAAIRTLGETCVAMCQGQALEARTAGDLTTDEATYLEIIRLKTAVFCRAAARIGARLGGAENWAVEAVARYGEHLGMTFQIVDDLLGYTGDDRVVGKPLSSDLANGRVTLPVIYAIESGGERTRARIRALFQADAAHRERAHHDLIRLLADQGALTRARARAKWYTASAKRELDRLPETPARERLRALADGFLVRDH